MNTLIIGAGAIGSLVGGKLAQSGERITLVGRERFVENVRQAGLRLTIEGETQQITNVRPVSSVAEAFGHAAEATEPYDLAVLTVKSYDTQAALTEMAAAVASNTQPVPVVLSLQNGVGNEEAIAARFGADKVIAGTITAPVEVPEPGEVLVTKPKFVVGLARWSPDLDEGRMQAAAHALRQSGMAVTLYADAQAMKWSKLLMNMIGNATSAILAEPPSRTFADPRVAALEIDALREALRVMRASGIAPINVGAYPVGTAAPFLRYAPRWLLRPILRRIVGGARGGKMPSLYLDLEKGKEQNEVNWYNGAIVRRGEALGVATPVNRTFTEVVQDLAQHPEQRTAWRGNVDRLVGVARSA